MWDILIGHEDERNKVCSAWTLYRVPDGPDISHNQVAYWVSGCVLNTGCKIMKDSPEGVELAALLEKPDPEAVKQWFAALVFRHCDPQTLAHRLEHAISEAHQAGRDSKAAEMRAVLGV